MMTMEIIESYLCELEEAILAVAGNDGSAVEKLHALLNALGVSEMPATVKSMIGENLEMIITDVAAIGNDAKRRELVLALADRGVDKMLMRDALATICRQTFSDYPDPAGLIRALSILDEETNVKTVRDRWCAFQYLKEGANVWHGSFGFGRVTEFDPFSNLIYISFDRRQSFDLEQAMTALAIARPDSFADLLLSGRKSHFVPTQTAAEIECEILDSFVPSMKEAKTAFETLLVPRFMSKKDFDDWRRGDSGSRPGQKAERTWQESRGLEELRDCLRSLDKISPDDSEAQHLQRLFQFAGPKATFRDVFAETLSLLWGLSEKTAWLEAIIPTLAGYALVWTTEEDFAAITRKLRNKTVSGWLAATLVAKGDDWFISAVLGLPLRLYDPAETVLKEFGREFLGLCACAHDKMKKGQVFPDTVLWLWRRYREETQVTFANPKNIFRPLARKVHGEHTKARKDLLKLLMDDPDFQTALMDGGSQEGIARFVQTIKNEPLLNKGERQSLLVKVVRLFPNAQDIVAERKQELTSKPMAKMSSFRSVQERQREFEEIISKKIPANIQAIAHARSYGDLRENAEYKAAKDEQRLLAARRRDLERDLNEIMPSDFSDIQIMDVVVPGCTVELLVDGTDTETYHILGLWDSDPDQKIISYETPLGRILMTRTIGETVTTPQGRSAVITELRELPDDIRKWVCPAAE